MMDAWPHLRPQCPLVGAHRGDSAHWPENSLSAFQGAIDAGADFIETDLRLTADGVAVACHDAEFSRLCCDSRAVADLTWAEASDLLPSLCTIKDVAGQVLSQALLLLDVKLAAAEDLTAMAGQLAAIKANGRIALGLRSLAALRALSGHLPGWPRLGLFADPVDYAALAAQGGTWARLWQADATAARIADLQALGLNVVIMVGAPTARAVGVIDPSTLNDLFTRAPDAVMLNDPGLAVRSRRLFPLPTHIQESSQ
jgi:glycerophosphoryl diester phosphodiesterase